MRTALALLVALLCNCKSTTTTDSGASINVIKTPQTFTHGTCAAVTLGYETGFVSENNVKESAAPSAITLTFQVTNGQAYADSGCTTPVSTLPGGKLTFAAGMTEMQVGFEPAQAGAFDFSYNQTGDDSAGAAGFSGTAQ